MSGLPRPSPLGEDAGTAGLKRARDWFGSGPGTPDSKRQRTNASTGSKSPYFAPVAPSPPSQLPTSRFAISASPPAPQITEEQKRRMEENRRKAMDKRKAREALARQQAASAATAAPSQPRATKPLGQGGSQREAGSTRGKGASRGIGRGGVSAGQGKHMPLSPSKEKTVSNQSQMTSFFALKPTDVNVVQVEQSAVSYSLAPESQAVSAIEKPKLIRSLEPPVRQSLPVTVAVEPTSTRNVLDVAPVCPRDRQMTRSPTPVTPINAVHQQALPWAANPSSGPSASDGRARDETGRQQVAKTTRSSNPYWNKRQSNAKGAWEWLNNPRDMQQRTPDDPDYDPTTLYVPEYAFRQLTPTRKQYWRYKRLNMDTLLFFQCGSFYELYGADAEIGAKIMDMKMTHRGTTMPMVGLPLAAYDKWSAKFVALGYKVARVDQIAGIDGKPAANCSRDLVQFLTPGTLVDSCLLDDSHKYLMCLFSNEKDLEVQMRPGGGRMQRVPGASFGVCLVDCSLAQFFVCQFDDDKFHTHLDTLLVQMRPAEIVYLQGNLTRATVSLLPRIGAPMLTSIPFGVDGFWDTVYLAEQLPSLLSVSGDIADFPPVLEEIMDEPMALAAFSGCVGYLSKMKLTDLVAQRKIERLDVFQQGASLVLDGQSLLNLEILENSFNHKAEGSLLSIMQHCSTPFGVRKFKEWLCHPLRKIDAINDRLDAVSELMEQSGVRERLISGLKNLADLERGTTRLHNGQTLPLAAFLELLDGFLLANELILSYGDGLGGENGGLDDDVGMDSDDEDKTKEKATEIESVENPDYKFASSLLASLTSALDGCFPDLIHFVEEFDGAVDVERSREANFLIPQPGFDREYDEASGKVDDLRLRLKSHLEEMKKDLSCPTMRYVSNAKGGKYQVEIDNKYLEKARGRLAPEMIVKDKLKRVTRFHDTRVEDIVSALADAEIDLGLVTDGLLVRSCSRLNKHYEALSGAVECLSSLDCLISLAVTSMSLGGMNAVCRPVFTESARPFLDLREMRHPFLRLGPDAEVIPNDIQLGQTPDGNGGPPGILLTGPNMGGKSTLLRQACIAVVMAQLGCFVPADSCHLSPVDRIFTRLGANDNIFEGQSTFMMELQETSTILNQATSHSLVILDELGRGTSTFDGTAIAHAVLHHLLITIGCRVMFATHYHMLVADWKEQSALVALHHMACIEDEDEREVTFLYKAVAGQAPSSHGMNVARMARMDEDIVMRAEEAATEFERNFRLVYARKKQRLALVGEESRSSQGNNANASGMHLRLIWSALRALDPTRDRQQLERLQTQISKELT